MFSKTITPFGMPDDGELDISFGQRLAGASISEARRRRVAIVAAESLRAMELLHEHGCDPFVSCFGSARPTEDDPEGDISEELAYELGVLGFNVMQGAGPGHMLRFARGVRRAGMKSIHNNIQCKGLWEKNATPDFDVFINHTNLYSRKLVFLEAEGFVYRPGGIGTLDEDTEVRAALQLGILSDKPMYLVGVRHFEQYHGFLRDAMLAKKFIGDHDLKPVITDDIKFVARQMKAHYDRKQAARAA